MKITIKNQSFILHQSGAVFWEEKKTLLISDVHLGKVAHFRKHGMAVPEAAIFENFSRLNLVLSFFNAEQIIFLGDLFHSTINNEWGFFSEWVNRHSQQIILIE